MGINNTLVSAVMALVGTVYAELLSDFARRHSLLFVTILAAFSLHIFYFGWGMVGDSPAPLGMAFLIMTGYAAVVVGCVRSLFK